MSALAGIIANDNAVNINVNALVPRMRSRLAHRAPDGFADWRSDGVAIVHGALHVGAAPIQATQPLRLADGRICVVDGFVANAKEVRHALGVDTAWDVDDAQLLALAVQKWAGRFHEHVQGEFALALWDPNARTLELYRDHLGARPLSYISTSGLFAFASEALALVELPGVSKELNPLGIASIWYDDAYYQDGSFTAFEGIHNLPAGHRLILEERKAPRIERYWRLQPLPTLRLHDEREYVEAFSDVFAEAVSRAMRGSRGTALMLSGGIDSGAILAARRGFKAGGDAGDLLCVSAVLAPGVDEPAAVAENRNILSMGKTHQRTLQFEVPTGASRDGVVTAADLAEAAWTWIHPADISLLVPSLACRLARDQGCRLMLNGIDGDNMTSGGRSYIDGLARSGAWGRVWPESVKAARVNTYLQGSSPLGLSARAVLASVEPRISRKLRGRLRAERSIRRIDTHPVMAPELAKRAGLAMRLRNADRLKHGDRAQHRCDHLVHWLGFSMGGSNQIMSRHGMEVRHPWCDRELLAFFLQLPAEFLTRDGWTKYLVRKACEPALGAEVVWHSGKSHLGGWINQQVLADAAPYLRELVLDQCQSLGAYVRQEAITNTVTWLDRQPLAELEDCDTFITIVSLAGWLRYINHGLFRGES